MQSEKLYCPLIELSATQPLCFLDPCLEDNNVLQPIQSGLRPGHSTITASTAVVDNTVNLLDKKQYTVALLKNLTKAFDIVYIDILLNKLLSIGFDEVL